MVIKTSQHHYISITLICFAAFASGCGSATTNVAEIAEGSDPCTLIQSVPKERPEWTVNESGDEEGMKNIEYTTISDKFSTETAARDDAYTKAQVRVAQYLNTFISNEIKKSNMDVSLSSAGLDPSLVYGQLTQSISSGVVQGVRPKKHYIEFRSCPEGQRVIAFLLSTAPRDGILDLARRSAREAVEAEAKSREIAKEKINDAVNAFDKILNAGTFRTGGQTTTKPKASLTP